MVLAVRLRARYTHLEYIHLLGLTEQKIERITALDHASTLVQARLMQSCRQYLTSSDERAKPR